MLTRIFKRLKPFDKHQSALAMFDEIDPDVYRMTLERGYDLWPLWQNAGDPIGAGEWTRACIAARVMCAMTVMKDGLAEL